MKLRWMTRGTVIWTYVVVANICAITTADTSCRHKHTEMSIPSAIRHNFEDYSSSKWQELLTVVLKWRSSTLRLRLRSRDIVPRGTLAEWHSGSNLTEVETLEDDVTYYNGYVDGLQGESHVALSIDDGEISGFIQTNNEGIFIEPIRGFKHGQHLLSSCGIVTPPPSVSMTGIHPSRYRRAPSSGYTKYLEVLIVADTTVVNFVGKDRVKHYILSLMNIVNVVYHDDTLGVSIEVVTVKIMYMDEASERSVIVANDPQRTVDSFCRWISSQTYRGASSGAGANHDVAVLLTRHKFSTAGYAPITGLCLPMRNCALVKDDGFTSSFVIAHEIAHVIGLMHDGHGNTCHGQAYTTSIMATIVQSSFNHYWWSGCSKTKMAEVIGTLPCLNNNPYIVVKEDIRMPLGMSWSLDEQCRLEFGGNARHCIYFSANDPCAQMWCTDDTRQYSCKTKNVVPLDGTQCGRTPEWNCKGGVCGYRGNQKPINGGWSQWTLWSDCSAQCGVGFKRRSRVCDSPEPQYDGKPCDGESENSDTCFAKECTEYTDPRALQCSMMDVVPVRGTTQKWKPYQSKSAEDRCKLTCIAETTNEVVTFDSLVDNGTPCSYDQTNYICLDGRCEKVGCDGIRGSSAVQDRCGVCKGNNSTCKVVSGTYEKTFYYSAAGGENYETVLVLPKASRDISISEASPSPHFLSLRDTFYYNHFLNGNGKQESSKDFVMEGAWFQYKNHYGQETLTTKGPLHRDVNLLVYAMDWQKPAKINYAYTVSKDDFTLEKNKYKWKYEDWSPCSVTCGKGVQHIIYGCFDKDTDNKVDEKMCQYIESRQIEDVPCEMIDCASVMYIWRMLRNYSDCSATCGTSGVRHRLYECERLVDNAKVDAAKFCVHIPEPIVKEPCNRIDCVSSKYRWEVTSEWSACSASCGDSGSQYQLFYCVKEFDDGRIIKADEKFCADMKSPKEPRKCNSQPCSDYKWESTDTWLECNESCGENGIQLKKYACLKYKDGTSSPVGIWYCASLEKPNESQPCNRRMCYTYKWELTDNWSECSHSCGNRGLKVRHVVCKNVTYDNRERNVDENYCSESKRPSVREECNMIPCESFHWKQTGEWTKCSKECGNLGTQKQVLSCHSNETGSKVVDSNCMSLEQMVIERPCNRIPCFNFEWRLQPDNWSPPCASRCYEQFFATQTQVAYCFQVFVRGQEERTEDRYCEGSQKPVNTRACEELRCTNHTWKKTELWSDCNATCVKIGTQTEVFECIQRIGSDVFTVQEHLCNQELKPKPNTKQCTARNCYKFGSDGISGWGPCSVTCGEGMQVRQQPCLLMDNGKEREVDKAYCEEVNLTRDTRPCAAKPCGFLEWGAGPWSMCSRTCGPGQQKRIVYCGDPSQPSDSIMCPGKPPEEYQSCQDEPCVAGQTLSCVTDRATFCDRARGNLCSHPAYYRVCCVSCQDFLGQQDRPRYGRRRRFHA